MRAYHICNTYLSGIMAGIQSAHTQHELALKVFSPEASKQQHKMYLDWAQNHKTLILLNGGYQSNLVEFVDLLDLMDCYPWAAFNESIDALAGALTNVCVVLPESMYGGAASIVLDAVASGVSSIQVADKVYTKSEVQLIEMMSRLRLMS